MPATPTALRTPAAPRWRRRPAERPGQILDAAAKVFARDGLQAATLDDVAREAGITKGTIYLYYRSKDELFANTLRRMSGRIIRTLEAASRGGSGSAAGAGSHRERILRIIDGANRIITGPGTLSTIQMVLSEAGRSPQMARLFFREVILKNNLRIAMALGEGMEAGEYRPMDPYIAARCLSGMILAFAISQKLLGGDHVRPIPRKVIVRAVASVFLDGIGERPGARRGDRRRKGQGESP